MERETGFEPATSSLGSTSAFDSKAIRRIRRRTACTENQPDTRFAELCSQICSKKNSFAEMRSAAPNLNLEGRVELSTARVASGQFNFPLPPSWREIMSANSVGSLTILASASTCFRGLSVRVNSPTNAPTHITPSGNVIGPPGSVPA